MVSLVSIASIICAATCNSVMDTSKDHYPISRLPIGDWWDGRTSWLNKYVNRDPLLGRTETLVQFTDAWHFFKMLMVIFLVLSIVTHKSIFDIPEGNTIIGQALTGVIDFLIYALLWDIVFNLNYDIILIRRKK